MWHKVVPFKRRLGAIIEHIGWLLDCIPARPFYRSKSTIAEIDAWHAEKEERWRKDHPDDKEFWTPDDEMGSRQWFGVISGYGCRMGICLVGINMQEEK